MAKSNKYIVLLIVIGIITIMVGTYLLYLSNSKRIFSKAINSLTSNTKEILDYENDLNNYTITNTLSIKTNTDNLNNYIKNNKEDISYNDQYRILNNINNLIDILEITSNKTNKELLINYSSQIQNKEQAEEKYYIKNNTGYYYIKGITKNYINNGSNDYFETLNSTTKEQDNLIYLNKTISNSLKNNLDNSYFVKIKLKNQIKISLELDNSRINKIRKGVLNDLKKDKRAKNILIGYDKNFFKNNRKNILKKKEKIYINIYTDNLLYNPLKYELIRKDNKQEQRIIYKPKQLIELYTNNKIKRIIKLNINKNKIKADIYNKNEKIGSLTINNKKNNKKIIYSVEENNKHTYMTATIDKYDIKDGKYKIKVNVKLNHQNNNKELYNLNITDLLELDDYKQIKEDISDSEFASSLSDKEKEQIKNKKQSIINRFK